MMLTKFLKTTLILSLLIITFTSCVTNTRLMCEPNVMVEMDAQDFEFSAQMTGEGKEVRILGIDWKPLFGKNESGTVSNGLNTFTIPIIGDFFTNPTSSYALFDMISKNAGYDVVFYPQFPPVFVDHF